MNANNITKGGSKGSSKDMLRSCKSKHSCLSTLITNLIPSNTQIIQKLLKLLDIISKTEPATTSEIEEWNTLYNDLSDQRNSINELENSDTKDKIVIYFNNLIIILLKNIIDTIILEYLNKKQTDLTNMQIDYATSIHKQRITETINMINKFIIKIQSFYTILSDIKTNHILFTLYKNQLLPYITFLLEDIKVLKTQIEKDTYVKELKELEELEETIQRINIILTNTPFTEDVVDNLLLLLKNIKKLPNISVDAYVLPPKRNLPDTKSNSKQPYGLGMGLLQDFRAFTGFKAPPAKTSAQQESAQQESVPQESAQSSGLGMSLVENATRFVGYEKKSPDCSELTKQINTASTKGGGILSNGENINKHLIKYINKMRILIKYYNITHKYYKYKIKYLNLIKSNTI